MTGATDARRVLVTGASGFIGSHCIEPLLQRGYEVIAVRRRREPREIAGVRWVEADLLDAGAIRDVLAQTRPSHLLHLAWYVEPGKMIGDEVNLTWLVRSIELLRAFRESGGQRCVVSGSCYEYDWRYGYCSETLTPLRPDTMYGAAKNSLAQAFLQWCQVSGLSGAWGRVFFLYGPNEDGRRLVPSVILSLLNGNEARSSHGEQIRDYMHAADVGEGLVRLLDSEASGAYNIATGRAVTIRSIVERIGALTGRPELLRIGALPARANDAPLVVADMERTLKDLDWRPRIGLDEGLAATIEWWRNNSNASRR